METSDLIRQFNESKAGRVINGSESFRNRLGRVLHGLSYNHPKLTALVGIGVSIAGATLGGPIGALATSPAIFGATYATVTPKRFEKAACEFLMNQGVRKAAAFSNFLEKQGIDPSTRETAVAQYLEQQAPKFGYYKEYQQEFPSAARQIVSAGTRGDLPLCHSQDLYKNEIIQETLTREKRKGGILKGLLYTFTKDARRIERDAEKLAAERWGDRQAWLAQPSETRGVWRSFYKEQAFQRATAGKTPQKTMPASDTVADNKTEAFSRLPQQQAMNDQFERLMVPESTRKLHDLKNKPAIEITDANLTEHIPDRDVVEKRIGARGDFQTIFHIRDNVRVAETFVRDKFKVKNDDKNTPKEVQTHKETFTNYLDPETQKVVQHVATFKRDKVDLKTQANESVVTESTETRNGTTYSRTRNTQTGETIFREQAPFYHREWQFDKSQRLTTFIDNRFETRTTPAEYRQTDYTYDRKGQLQSSVEQINTITPDGETNRIVRRDATGTEIPSPSNTAEITSDPAHQPSQGLSGRLSQATTPINSAPAPIIPTLTPYPKNGAKVRLSVKRIVSKSDASSR